MRARLWRLMPLVLVAMLALGVCSVSLAYAEPERSDVCSAVKKGSESASTSVAELPVVSAVSPALTAPVVPSRAPVSEETASLVRERLDELRAPRAPPSA